MSKQQKALLVGSSFSAAPIFFALKKHGLHVSVCGNIETDPCHQYADESFYIDYSNSEDLMKVVESHKIDYLVPSCNDYSYMSCVPIAEKHGFIGFDQIDVAKILHTKSDFRHVTEKHSLPVPKFIRQKEEKPLQTGNLRFPLLVKPIDSFSGRGLTKILHDSELQSAVQIALSTSRFGEVILEEFVDGSLHSYSAFIESQEVVLDFFVDEFCTVYPYQVNCSNHPSALPDGIRSSIRSEINRFARILGLNDGLLHTQFIVCGNEFQIIECMRRCPGDLYGTLIGFSTGIDYADLYIRPFLNLKLPSKPQEKINKYYVRHTISTDKPLINFSFSNNIPSTNIDIISLKGSGEKLEIAPFDKLAILFAEFEDKETMLGISPRLADFVRIRTLGSDV